MHESSIGEVLFISHDASGTGAPYVLLLLLGWLKEHTSLQLRIILAAGGPGEDAFRELAPTYTVPLGNSWLSRSCLKLALAVSWRLYQKLSLRFLKQYVRQYPIVLIYSNTITNGVIVSALSELDVPVITHVHELRSLFEQCRREGSLDKTLRRTHRFIAVADVVKDNMVRNFDIDPALIDVINGFIALDKVAHVPIESVGPKVRELVGAQPEDYLYVGCGTLYPRKGPDLFLAVAQKVNSNLEENHAHFVWVAGQKESNECVALIKKAVSLGLQNYVHFVGHRVDYLDFLAAADVFLMTSREDPFPLVILEAAALGRPIVCFEGAGGTQEFVRNDAGICVPCEDVEAMADAVIGLALSVEKRAILGEIARQRAYNNHSVNLGASRIYQIISGMLSGNYAQQNDKSK